MSGTPKASRKRRWRVLPTASADGLGWKKAPWVRSITPTFARGCVKRPFKAGGLRHVGPGELVLSREGPSYRMVAGLSDSTLGRVLAHDKRCPGPRGWGKSTAASGRRGGGHKIRFRFDVTPGLRKSGWLFSSEDSHPSCRAACRHASKRWGLERSSVCSRTLQLQKSMGGVWRTNSGE